MKAYPWKTNHSNEQPCRLICYDTESWPDEVPSDLGRVAHRFRLGCGKLFKRKGDTWHERESKSFSVPSDMLQWIMSHCRPRETLWVYAHNQAFDSALLGLWYALDTNILALDKAGTYYPDPRTGESRMSRDRHGTLAVDNLPFILDTFSDRGVIKWVDTLNYLPVPLAKLATWCGLVKWELPSESASDEDWYAYCMNDVAILAAAVMKLLNLWRGERLGNWQPTIAGLAYSCFRHLAPNNGIVAHGDEPATPDEIYPYWSQRKEIPLDAFDLSRLERRAYYGARTLVGFVGDIGSIGTFQGRENLYDPCKTRARIDGPVTVLDVNGLYAHCMTEYQFPVKLLDSIIEPNIDQLTNMAFHYPCVADVLLSTPDVAYPMREDKRTYYVRGRFQTTLCGGELRRAVESGHVIKCQALAIYHAGQPFRDFVLYWWDIRLRAIAAGDECTAKLAKNLINALYGKLAQRKPLWERVYDVNPPIPYGPFLLDNGDGRGFQRYRAVAGAVQRLSGRRDCQHTFIPAAAAVTSHGRIYMERLRRIAPARSIVYQDTDSLFCLPPAVAAFKAAGMVHPTAMGKLKEDGTYESMSIYGPKNYDKGEINVVAGLRTKRQQVGHRKWLQWHYERANSIVARQPDGTVHAWQQLFAAPGTSPGFSVHGDGWTVPIRRA